MAKLDVKFPEIQVPLVGEDGNAFMIIGRVARALRRAGEAKAAEEFTEEAMKGDYDHVLQTVLRYVDVT